MAVSGYAVTLKKLRFLLFHFRYSLTLGIVLLDFMCGIFRLTGTFMFSVWRVALEYTDSFIA